MAGIQHIEKMVTVSTVLVVFLTALLVVFLTFVPYQSGICDWEVDLESSMLDYNTRVMRVMAGGPAELDPVLLQASEAPPVPAARGGEAPKSAAAVWENKDGDAATDDYFDAAGRVPKEELVDPSIPWLRRQPGVTYLRPVQVAGVMVEKYRHFDDAWDLAQEGGGEFRDTEFGRAYQVNWVQESSQIYRRVGLRKDDLVLSVNGHDVGGDFGAARALYDQLKDEKHFAIKILRGGKPMVMSYSVR